MARWPRALLSRFIRAVSRRSDVCGVTVYTAGRRSQRELLSAKVAAGLELMQRYDSRRLDRLRQDIRGIVVWPLVSAAGGYVPEGGVCTIDPGLLRRDKSGVAAAVILAHEGMHAHLYQRGYGYAQPVRGRIERICKRAELQFLLRLPEFVGRDRIISATRTELRAALERDYSDRVNRVRLYAHLRRLSWPKWAAKVTAYTTPGRST